MTLFLSSCVSTTQPLIPVTPRIQHVQLDAAGNVTTALQPLRASDVRIEGNRLFRGEKPLSPAFKAIDSFDVSESRGEVVFSAKRSDHFEIGLVSTDGSPISWVPSQNVDQVGVQWAPLGNKITFIVRAKGGDYLRTLHVPTSAQLLVDFPGARVGTFGWDPKGERFAVVYSTPDASDRVEVMTYSGNERKIAIPPAQQLDVETASFAPEAVSLRPRDIEYNEKLPLVVWVDDEPFAWSDARAELMRTSRVVCIVTRRLDDVVWQAAAGTPWIDRGRTFVVAPKGTRVRDAVVITLQSTAPRFIAERLKRTRPRNGSSR